MSGVQEGSALLSLWLAMSGGQGGSIVSVARDVWGQEGTAVAVAHDVWGAW